MNRERASRAYDLIAEGFAELAIAVREIEPAAARAAVPAAGVVSPPAPALADDFPPLPATAPPPLNPQVDAGLGVCPIHGVHWTVKAAGTNAAGVSWEAFYKCSEKDESQPKGWCTQKPQKIWRDTHPIREVAA